METIRPKGQKKGTTRVYKVDMFSLDKVLLTLSGYLSLADDKTAGEEAWCYCLCMEKLSDVVCSRSG